MKLAENVYKYSPYALQHLLFNCYASKIHFQKFGSEFQRALQKLKENENLSAAEMEAFQYERLKSIVTHAYNTVPFYQELYKKHGVSPGDLKSLEDLSKFPIVTKDDMKAAKSSLISQDFKPSQLFKGSTSGTTGTPFSFYWDKNTCIYTNAVDWRQKRWAGVEYGERIALFLGRTVVSTGRTKPPFWQRDRLHNMLWFSSFHLSEEYIAAILQKLVDFRPSAIEGYPSTMFILAKYAQKSGIKLPLKAVFTSSETLLPNQRELIETVFSTEVFDFYGMAERVVFATECPEHHNYHLNFDYAINEIVDSEGNRCPEGKDGYLTGTSLLNYAMPFIRYKSTDVTAISSESCGCGRSMKTLKGVTTKDEDIVVTPDGRLVSSSALTHPFKPLSNIIESQIIQNDPDTLIIKLVSNDEIENVQKEKLVLALRERVGNMEIKIEQVDHIPRTANGKFRWVISKVRPNF